MRYVALATDYDGTLTKAGVVDETTIEALRCFRQSGRKLILVTGRELPDLEKVFPHLDLFQRVVAENYVAANALSMVRGCSIQRTAVARVPPHSFVGILQKSEYSSERPNSCPPEPEDLAGMSILDTLRARFNRPPAE